MSEPPAGLAPPRSELPVAIVTMVVHGALTLFLVMSVIFWVPIYERKFRDFAVALPSYTSALIAVSRWMQNYWYVLVFPVGVGLALDGLLVYVWRRRPSTEHLARYWMLFVAIVLVVAWILGALAIVLPYAKLVEGIGK
jgi:type II secretory pathway component PulF